jgi:hypothetical protein
VAAADRHTAFYLLAAIFPVYVSICWPPARERLLAQRGSEGVYVRYPVPASLPQVRTGLMPLLAFPCASRACAGRDSRLSALFWPSHGCCAAAPRCSRCRGAGAAALAPPRSAALTVCGVRSAISVISPIIRVYVSCSPPLAEVCVNPFLFHGQRPRGPCSAHREQTPCRLLARHHGVSSEV